MPDVNFLPEDDQDFLRAKGIDHTLLRERVGEEDRRGIEFLNFTVPPNLFLRKDGVLTAGGTVSLMITIPKGYSTTKLDSWYVWPPVYLANGQPANCAGSEADMFGHKWQFWSRHLADDGWRDGVDGLSTYLQHIRAGLRDP